MPRIAKPRPRLVSRERAYMVLSFSMFPEDDERLDRIVAAEQTAGRRANRSSVIRLALEHYERTALVR